jgi:zinc protease
MSSTVQITPMTPADATPLVGAQAQSFVLGNGLQVVVIPDRRAPVVTHMVWYKVGSADEPPGKSGIAHYLEHLMFKGTRNNPDGAFSAKVAEVGGQENAFTSSDYTAYFQRVAREHLAMVMELEADRMANLVLSEAVAKPELQVVLEERASRTDNDPSSLLSEAMEATSYIAHPYRIPVIGWRHEIEQLTYRDALEFYDRFYTPNNAVLVIAGDVTLDEVRTLAEATYGRVARRAEPGERRRPQEPAPTATREVRLADPRVTQSSLRLGWVVPSYTTAKPGEAEALDVMADILGSRSTGRLYRQLVVEKGLASSAGGWYGSTALDDTKAMIFVTPRDQVKLEDVQAAALAVVADFAVNGPTPEELARAKRKVLAEAIYAQDSQQTLARIFGAALTTGGSIEDVQTWPERIKRVTAEEVKAVAAQYFTERRMIVGKLLPAPGGAAAGGGAVTAPAPAGAIRRGEAPVLPEFSVTDNTLLAGSRAR